MGLLLVLLLVGLSADPVLDDDIRAAEELRELIFGVFSDRDSVELSDESMDIQADCTPSLVVPVNKVVDVVDILNGQFILRDGPKCPGNDKAKAEANSNLTCRISRQGKRRNLVIMAAEFPYAVAVDPIDADVAVADVVGNRDCHTILSFAALLSLLELLAAMTDVLPVQINGPWR